MKSLRQQVQNKIFVYTAVIAITLSLLIYVTMSNLTYNIAETVALESSNVISTEINSLINRELYIALSLSNNQAIKNWMKDESNKANEALALEAMAGYLKDFTDNNIFFALDKSHNFFFIEDDLPLNMVPIYQLDPVLKEDAWFFKTKDLDKAYDLNVDVDRYLNTIRIWINIKVYDQDEFLGIMGTGIELSPILNHVFNKEDQYYSESIMFDSYGAVQLTRDYQKIQENSFGSTDYNKSIYSYTDTPDAKKAIEAFIDQPSENDLIVLEPHRSFMILSPIDNTDWFMATYYSTDQIISLKDFTLLILAIACLFLFLVLGLNKIIRNGLIKPIENLNHSLLEDQTYGLDRQDEIGNLANTIVNMTLQLRLYSNELEGKYRVQSDLLNKFLDKAPVGIVKVNQDLDILTANDYFTKLFKGHHIASIRDIISPKVNLLKDLKHEKKVTLECCHLKETFWLEFQGISKDHQGQTSLLIADITDKKIHEIELLHIASIDPLTGIYNRRHFEALALKEMVKAKKAPTNLCLILFDIDFFKAINDKFGHPIGDQILQSISRLVESKCRSTDSFARWGGEEFILLLSHASIGQALSKAEELRQMIADYDFNVNQEVTVSFGVTQIDPDEAYDEAFKRVDQNLYYAKEHGRNQVHGS